ncbi:MAG: hypothetical protein FP814_00860 [Desulfobacterium sp.]|nr:hypothetical protein [Desulfobacteraceae bacterium]MBA3035022.1 hypothetical protein [Desulfobacterium sp.]
MIWGLLIGLLASVWVYGDAKDRGLKINQALLWGICTLLLVIIVLPAWLVTRPKQKAIHHNKSTKILIVCVIIILTTVAIGVGYFYINNSSGLSKNTNLELLPAVESNPKAGSPR